MAIPLDETRDKADAAFGNNPEGMPQGHFLRGAWHMAPIAAFAHID